MAGRTNNKLGDNQHVAFKNGQRYKRKRPAQPVSHLSLGDNKAHGSRIKPSMKRAKAAPPGGKVISGIGEPRRQTQLRR